MDPAQLGGEKGSSILPYLILLFDFIFSKTDSQQTEPHAIIAALMDFEKGFTKVNHNKVLIRLSDWGTPGWLLRVIASYLANREMIVRYKGEQSKAHALPSGGPMGDILGMIIFLVEVSDCCMDPAPPLPPDSVVGDVACVPAPRRQFRQRMKFD